MTVKMYLSGCEFISYGVTSVELIEVCKDGSGAMLIEIKVHVNEGCSIWDTVHSYRYYVDKFIIE